MSMEVVPASPAHRPSGIPGTLYFEVAAWLAGLEMAIRYHRIGLMIVGVLALWLIGQSAWRWRRRSSTNVASLATGLIVVTTIAVFSFVSGPWPQHTVALVSVGLLWLTGRQRQRPHDSRRGRTMALTTAVLIWFGWYSLLSASIYLNIQLTWLVMGAGAMTGAAALLVWLESGLNLRPCRWGLLAMVWFGAELWLVTWWLPTSIIVGSVLAATVNALVIQASRHLWAGHWEAGRSRRYLLVGSVVILLTLATARWI